MKVHHSNVVYHERVIQLFIDTPRGVCQLCYALSPWTKDVENIIALYTKPRLDNVQDVYGVMTLDVGVVQDRVCHCCFHMDRSMSYEAINDSICTWMEQWL